MRGLGEGIRNFKEGMHTNTQTPPNPPPPANPPTVTTAPPPLGEDKK
jgi:hypothetical protein